MSGCKQSHGDSGEGDGPKARVVDGKIEAAN